MSGLQTSDTNLIKKDVFKFYNDLLGVDPVKDNVLNEYDFKIKSLNMTESESDNLNKNITYDEAYKVIKKMKVSAPGSSGLTISFYKKFFEFFGEYFITILNGEGELPNVFMDSLVKLIPKNNNSVKNINDLRPISLTNIDYRIYKKILANRLRVVSASVIGDHQTCSIPNRSINDNINIIRDIIFENNLSGSELYLVSVDESKAFDRLSPKYLFKLLEHLNFGNFILKSIKKIYNRSCAKIIINNSMCDLIYIISGLKQGCALSMLLYILCIEELIIRIKLNDRIKGYFLNMYNKQECKAAGYADDISGFLQTLESIGLFFNEFEEWGSISGAILNVNKTKILALNSNYTVFNNIRFIETLKILGIEFNSRGISENNLENIIERIEKSVFIWSCVNMSVIDRIIACKTFILSKLWYLANFIIVNEKKIKIIDRIVHKYIWNSPIERIKRNTLILPYDNGGLKSVCIRARLNTILTKNFIYVLPFLRLFSIKSTH